MVTEQELAEITRMQESLLKELRSISEKGVIVLYGGIEIIVYKGVLQPGIDSIPLVESYTINKGDSVLDVCTGSGQLAVISAYKGAERIVALDINPEAVRTARENAARHGFSGTINVRLSDMFDALSPNEQFDVITGNLPFQKKEAHDFVDAAFWDTDLRGHQKFFGGVNEHLKQNGRVYLSQANFGAIEEMKAMATEQGFRVKQIGEKRIEDKPMTFYAFELTR